MLHILFSLTLGIILFLGGMKVMQTGLYTLAGDRLKLEIVRFTRTPFRGLVTGTIFTALLQSSSAVSVITIGLTHAQLLSFRQTIGIILGANIGTTFTTQLIAINIGQIAYPLFIIGCTLLLIPKKSIRFSGLSITGFGCILIAMNVMQSIAIPLQKTSFFTQTIPHLSEHLVYGLLLGTGLTALIHSSSGVTALTMGFMNEHLFPLTTAIAIILGSNVGTCISAVMAAVGANVAAKQVAWVHVFLNVAGVLLFYPFIYIMAQAVPFLSSQPDQQIAHIQTFFNVLCSLLAIPFTKQIAWMATKFYPNEPFKK